MSQRNKEQAYICVSIRGKKAQHVLLDKLKAILENNFFAIMTDEYTDISNLEKLSIYLKTV